MPTGNDPSFRKRIREYEILEVIGRGGMGAVYKARHVLLDEERAIKVIQARLAGDKDFVDRFIREAKILIKLRHPHLVQLYEFGTLEEDTFFMVLELIRGESVLERILRRKRIPIDETMRIVREAALGLQNAHQKGIIHRDISPDNLMIVKDDFGNEITKVLDFGIAKPLFESTQHFTVTNIFIGKPEYCSPEQCGVLEENEIIDQRSDIYSLAVTLYHMIAGKLPFYSRTPQGYLIKHASETPKPLSSHFPDGSIPPALDKLVAKALSKRREDRQASMDELIREIDQLSIPQNAITEAFTTPIPVEIRIGDLFARRYLIEDKLGQGGFGSVYKATDKILEIPVALKVLRLALIENPTTLERLKREVILARKVVHKNVCRIYDIGESAGQHYITMEYLEGRTLADMLTEESRLSPEIGLPILRDVLLALEEAHRVGVIHRDLKPQNILVDFNLHARIMDFGISISADLSRVTQAGVSIGTPYYMAPEQFEGKNIDQRADIYSLGIIMYEMFVGELPFKANTPMAIVFAHLKEAPRKPSEIVPKMPPALEAIILKTLEKEAVNRFQTVKELLKALEPLLSSSTMTGAIPNREQLAHKLIAERNYSQAVKLLAQWATNEPRNASWKKLLSIARSEKTKRDVRRVRALVKKNNLMRAQLLVEKIKRFNSENDRVITEVKKLEQLVLREKKKSIEAYLQQAREQIANRDWAAASACLESAWNLDPNNPVILAAQEEIQKGQEEQNRIHLQGRLQHEKELFAKLAEEETEEEISRSVKEILQRVEALLHENPGYEPGIDFQTRLTEFLDLQSQSRAIKDQLQKAADALQAVDLNRASSIVGALLGNTRDQTFRKDVSRIDAGFRKIAALFSQGEFEKISAEIEPLLREDPRGWLTPHRQAVAKLSELAARKQQEDRAFREAAAEANRLMEQREWEHAINAWKRALEVSPDEPAAQQGIAAAESRLRAESQIRKELTSELQKVEGSIQARQWMDAQKLLDQAAKRITNEYRLDEFTERLEKCRSLIASGIRQDTNAKSYADAMEKGKKLLNERRWEEAISQWKAASGLLPEDPTAKEHIRSAEQLIHSEAEVVKRLEIQLRKADELLLQKQFSEVLKVLSETENAFASDFRLGEQERRVRDLRDHANRALALEKDRTEKEAAAQKRLQQEKEIRASLQSDFSEIRNAIQGGNLKNAKEVLGRARSRITPDFPVEDLALQLAALAEELGQAIKLKKSQDEKFQSAFQLGKKLYDSLDWKQAVEVWQSALALAPENHSVQEWIEKAQARLSEEKILEEAILLQLEKVEELIEAGRLEEAKALSAEVTGNFGKTYKLSHASNRTSELRDRLQKAWEKVAARQETIERELSEARKAFDKGNAKAALQMIGALLEGTPGFPPAVEFERTVKAAIHEQEKSATISQLIQTGLSLLAGDQYGELPTVLQRLKEVKPDSPDLVKITTQLSGLAQTLQSGDLQKARKGLQDLSSNFPLVQAQKNQLEELSGSIAEKEQTATRFNAHRDDGLRQFHSKHWNQAVEQFEKANAISPGQPQIQEYLSSAREKARQLTALEEKLKSVTAQVKSFLSGREWDKAIDVCNSALKEDFSEFHLEPQLSGIRNLLDSAQTKRTKELLETAARFKKAGQKEESLELYQKLLAFDPRNPIALAEVQALMSPVAQAPAPARKEAKPTKAFPSYFKWAAAAVFAVIVGVSAWQFLPAHSPQQSVQQIPAAPAKPSASFQIVSTPVMINALPWARIKISSTNPMAPGIEFPDEKASTPFFIELPPGEYVVELSNDVTGPSTQHITVRPGVANQFLFHMPSYDPNIVAAQLAEAK